MRRRLLRSRSISAWFAVAALSFVQPPSAARADENEEANKTDKASAVEVHQRLGDNNAQPNWWIPDDEESTDEQPAEAVRDPRRTLERLPENLEAMDAPGRTRKRLPENTTTEPGTGQKPGEAPLTAQNLPTADRTGVTGKTISVPKGEGTVQGMEESFSAQLSTGTASFTIPFALPPARGRAQPSLSLTYMSGAGLGEAGMGWSTGAPFIARQTDKGIPRYNDQGGGFLPDQDRYVFNGGQELVPICVVGSDRSCPGALVGGVDPEEMPIWAAGHTYFRPRVEGSFLRFYRQADGLTWRVQSKNGVTMEFGVPLDGTSDKTAIEANPDNPGQIYRWHLVRMYDPYGNSQADKLVKPFNLIVYRYRQDGGKAYLSDVYDTPPASIQTNPDAPLAEYAHHTHLWYEPRPDRTASYRSGYRIEQNLRLTQVDVASKPFAGSGPRGLLRRYHLTYDPSFHMSFLTSLQIEGRCGGSTGTPVSESAGNGPPLPSNCPRLPPVRFSYTHVEGAIGAAEASAAIEGFEAFDERVVSVGSSPPYDLDSTETVLHDVDGDGVTDVLVTAPALFGGNYGVFFNEANGTTASFRKDTMPVLGVLGAQAGDVRLSNLNVAALDLDGNGVSDLVHMATQKQYAVYSAVSSGKGFAWQGRAIETADKLSPKIDFGSDTQNIKVVDVNFDGLVDVVRSTGDQLETFLSLGRYPGGDGRFGTGRLTSNTTATLSTEPIRSCLPWAGVRVQLGDRNTSLGDMNGDGIVDIVRLDRGRILYWPGRGNGYWGTTTLEGCPAGGYGQNDHIEMGQSPYYSDLQGDSLRLDDVNGDGLSDLVQVNYDQVQIWLNVNGESWTKPHLIEGTPHSPSFARRVQLTDINGSGTLDILWGDGEDYEYLDLSGGTRPGLLSRVENGLGKSTDLEYTSTTAERALAAGSNRPWKTRMPMVAHVVKKVTVSDNLTIAGRPPRRDVTEYSYFDPVYDPRQREFRGFTSASARRVGDGNSPAETAETTFLLGACFDEDSADGPDACSLSESWRDNPHEALKGLPFLTEIRNDAGIYLSGSLNKYRLRELYVGLDGRTVRHAFLAEALFRRHDVSAFVPSSTVDSPRPIVTRSRRADNPLHDRATEVAQDVLSAGFPRRGTTVVDQITINHVDYYGNALYIEAKASTEEQGLPQAETLWRGSTRHMHPAGDVTKWTWVPFDTFFSGLTHSNNGWKDATFEYDSRGTQTRVISRFLGTLPLVRDVSDSAFAPPRSGGTDPTGWVNVDTRIATLDAFGNVTQEQGANGRCRGITYDPLYAQLPIEEKLYRGGCNVEPLTTTAVQDRGFGLPTETAFEGRRTKVEYDAFGRLTRLFRPHPTTPDVAQSLPSVEIDYALPANESVHHSIVHTKTQDGTSPLTDAQYFESWAYIDGLGRTFVTMKEAEPAAGGPDRFIASALTDTDAKGAGRRKFVEFFVGGPPTQFDFAKLPPGAYGSIRYDAFGREIQRFDVDGTMTLKTVYHAASKDLWDAADLEPGPHQGTYATERFDAHGRLFETTERFHLDGLIERRITRTQYTPFGAPEIIRRIRGSNNQETSRYMVYDRQGRLVLTVEPNSSATTGYVLEPNPNLNHGVNINKYANTVGWRYAYNDAGDLVGFSDPRGCGANYFHDALGRLLFKDYFPCEPHHLPYSVPTATPPVSGFEARYFYDYEIFAGNLPSGFTYTGIAFLQGRLVASQDQAGYRVFDYDGRGRVVKEGLRVARPGAVANVLTERYARRWYQRQFQYDAMDRPIRHTTGASVAELMGVNGTTPESAVTCAYNRRGAIHSVSSSYGSLVAGIDRTADALVSKIQYGDVAGTTTAFDYDFRRRRRSVQTYRGPPASAWPPNWSTSPPGTFQLLLQDEDYKYDVVGNPTEIHDYRIAEEWPAGAKPVSKLIEYDDLYRAVSIYYDPVGPSDPWTPPFTSENSAYQANPTNPDIDPRRALPMPQVNFTHRVRTQRFDYDWLGNTENTTDDASGFYDRSLGAIQNGTMTVGPYQLRRAQIATGGRTGELTTQYDQSGNLTRLVVDRNGPCIPAGAQCSHTFKYEWDELNRLTRARRWDHADVDADAPPNVDSLPPKAVVTYRYDGDDNRVIKTSQNPVTSVEFHTLYVFDSLELRRARYDSTWGDGTDPDYELTRTTEVPYLAKNGVNLGRVVWEPTIDPGIGNGNASLRGNQRVFIPLPDHLGSTSIVIDRATSEMVERTTYQGYGATDSDYRPPRWEAFREDYRFTGKEEDAEVGLQYFGKRFYAPQLGRWMNVDPLVIDQPGTADPNLYAYVKGQALKAIDPLGLCETGGICPNQQGTSGNPHQPGNAPDHSGDSVDVEVPAPSLEMYRASSAERELDAGSAPQHGGTGGRPAAAPKAHVSTGGTGSTVEHVEHYLESSYMAGPSTGGTGSEQKPQDFFAYYSLSQSLNPGPVRAETEEMWVFGFQEDHFYSGGIAVTGVAIGGEANYVEAFHGGEIISDLPGGDPTPDTGPPHEETINLFGVGVGLEVPLVGGTGVTTGSYMTEHGSGDYVGAQVGAFGEHFSLGVGWSVQQMWSPHANPENGSEGTTNH
jgi:RHS repeat-associated protein